MRSEESSDLEWGRMEESSVRRSLETLCQELNMDEHTATEALENFTAIWNTYTLEVRRLPPDLSGRTCCFCCCCCCPPPPLLKSATLLVWDFTASLPNSCAYVAPPSTDKHKNSTEKSATYTGIFKVKAHIYHSEYAHVREFYVLVTKKRK